MLGDLFNALDAMRPKDTFAKIKLPRPITGKLGGRMTKFSNFGDICAKINRSPEHVAAYINKELCVTSSLTPTFELKIKYRLGPDRACTMITKYMNEWVKCSSCASMTTTLIKNPVLRNYSIRCDRCLCTISTTAESI